MVALQIICTAHSKLSVDGQSRGGGKDYLAIIAKDGEKKGFFVRIVDKEVFTYKEAPSYEFKCYFYTDACK